MKVDKEFPERVRNTSEKDFCNFYFLKVDISLIMHDPYLKLYIFKTLLSRELSLRTLIQVLVHFL